MVARNRRSNPQEVEEIRQLIRSAGVRATPARIAALQELRAAKSPMTHADLADTLVPQGFDKATVFRNLSDLTEVGLVNRTELGDHVWRFEVRDPENPDQHGHPHFVCTECGHIECLSAVEVSTVLKRTVGRIGRISELLIRGECTGCLGSVND